MSNMLSIEIYYYIDHSISLCLPSNIVISFGLYDVLPGDPSYIFPLFSRSIHVLSTKDPYFYAR